MEKLFGSETLSMALETFVGFIRLKPGIRLFLALEFINERLQRQHSLAQPIIEIVVRNKTVKRTQSFKQRDF